jgi:hypothetical protein
MVAIQDSVAAWTLLYYEEPALIGGVAASPVPGCGRPWMLATNRIEEREVARWLARHSRKLLQEVRQYFPLLENWVHSENKVSLRWVRWMGFSIDEQSFVGREGSKFIRIYMEQGAEQCVTL